MLPPLLSPGPHYSGLSHNSDLVQRFHGTNHIDFIPQPRPEESAPKSGLPDFGNLKVSKSATADFDARPSRRMEAREASPLRAGPMSLADQANAFTQQIVEFARTHEVWAAPIIGALAFGESLAFISLLIPAWAILVALGTLIGTSGLNFWPIWVGGAVGAALGDWLSYWVGV